MTSSKKNYGSTQQKQGGKRGSFENYPIVPPVSMPQHYGNNSTFNSNSQEVQVVRASEIGVEMSQLQGGNTTATNVVNVLPHFEYNDDKNERLKSYYGNPVCKFELGQAIQKKILCPYEYHVVLVSLTYDEQEEYREISKEISRLYSITGDMSKINPGLLSRRSRLLGNAENKITELEKLLKSKKPEPYTLFYCGEGSHPMERETDNDEEIESLRQIEAVTRLIHAYNWKSSKYTSRETKNVRKDTMEIFKDGSIDALVAMKCLDEGIDIPLCKTAYLISSTNNPRQYIQRSGRILRKHPDKKQAKIIDFFSDNNKVLNASFFNKALLSNGFLSSSKLSLSF